MNTCMYITSWIPFDLIACAHVQVWPLGTEQLWELLPGANPFLLSDQDLATSSSSSRGGAIWHFPCPLVCQLVWPLCWSCSGTQSSEFMGAASLSHRANTMSPQLSWTFGWRYSARASVLFLEPEVQAGVHCRCISWDWVGHSGLFSALS